MRVFSVWLIPQSEDYQRLMDAMRTIADRLNTPVFRPHLTIGSVKTEFEIESYFSKVSIPPQLPKEIDGEDVFTRSFFLRFIASPELKEIRSLLEAHPDAYIGRPFDPHISLCYGPPPDDALSVAQKAALISKPVTFDRIELTEISIPVETYEDVLKWKTVETAPIG